MLVVEDSPDNQKVIKILLDKLGLSSALAEDGQQAVDAIAQGDAADLVLMDVQMPLMDGYAATERIREWEQETGQRRRPIIALTADAFDENRRRCLAAGMDDVLTKPVAFDALKEVFSKWLPAAPGAQAPPAVEVKPVDIPRVVALLDEIMPLLAQNRFDAITRFRELQQAVAGTGIAAEMGEIGRLLEQVRFDLALDRLRGMAATHGWESAAGA